MKRTTVGTIAIAVAVGAVLAFGGQTALAAASLPTLRPEYTISLSLVALAVLDIALALPIYRAARANPRRRVDPFHATRVVILAKASSLVGAVMTGVAIGLAVDLLARPIELGPPLLLRLAAAFVAAVVLLAAGLVAEWLCRVPPEDTPNDAPPPSSVEA